LYAGAAHGGDGYVATPVRDDAVAGLPVMDRYVLAKTAELVETMTEQMDAYDVPGASESLRQYLDLLTNWYVRTQRDRFWDEDQAAFDVLFTVLETVCRLAAPLLPLITEEVWRGLTGSRSVHLADYPVAPESWADESLGGVMDQVREAVSVAHGLRKARQIRVRQPLAELRVAVEDAAALEPYVGLIAEELNVKAVELLPLSGEAAASYGVQSHLTVNARAAGPRLGKEVQTVITGAKSGDWSQGADGLVVSGGIALEEGEYDLSTVIGGAAADDPDVAAAVLADGGFVVLSTALTPELESEGYALSLIHI